MCTWEAGVLGGGHGLNRQQKTQKKNKGHSSLTFNLKFLINILINDILYFITHNVKIIMNNFFC